MAEASQVPSVFVFMAKSGFFGESSEGRSVPLRQEGVRSSSQCVVAVACFLLRPCCRLGISLTSE